MDSWFKRETSSSSLKEDTLRRSIKQFLSNGVTPFSVAESSRIFREAGAKGADVVLLMIGKTSDGKWGFFLETKRTVGSRVFDTLDELVAHFREAVPTGISEE